MTTQTLCVDCKEELIVPRTTVTTNGHTLICMTCEGKRIVATMTRIYQKGGMG